MAEKSGAEKSGVEIWDWKFWGCNVFQPPFRRQVPSIIIIPGTPKVDKLSPFALKPKISVEINDGTPEIAVEDTSKGQEISIEIFSCIQFLQKMKDIVFPISTLASKRGLKK